MNILQKTLTIIACISLLQANGQFHYNFNTSPDSAIVFVNGEEECTTPCKVKFRWMEAVNGKIVFEVQADGYKTWTNELTKKPRSLDLTEDLDLELKFPIFDLKENNTLISFDKLIADFKDGKVIGKVTDAENNSEDIKWSGSIKVGDDVFESSFYEMLTDMGYKSAYSESAKLFSGEQNRRPKLPRYMVGVEITDYNIELNEEKSKNYYYNNVKGRLTVEYSWSVLDKSNGEVVYKKVNQGIHRFTQSKYEEVNHNLLTFKLALIDFLGGDDFNQMVVNSEDVEFTNEALEDESGSKKKNSIETVVLVKAATKSEMFQKASEACVTIITDGGHGSGVVVSKKGIVLTAYHVIEGVNQINVKFSSGLSLKAKLIDFDKFNDIAILDITGEGFNALPLAPKGQNVNLGEELFTIGTPADVDLGQSISKGILSGKRKIEDRIYFQTDISVSPGNSGGPVLNMNGEVVGIVQKKLIGEGIEGIGLSLPIDEVRRIMGFEEKPVID